MELTFSLIEPLLIKAEIEGNNMICEFRLPGSPDSITSSARIKRENTVKSQATRILKRNLTNQLRRGASRALRGVLGGGIVGRTGSSIFNSVTRETARDFQQSFTKEEKDAAIMEAFGKVAENFYFDEEEYAWTEPPKFYQREPSKRWKKEILSDFEKQLKDKPVRDRFEREVLARLLVEVASADNEITEDEIDFINSFIGPDLGSFDELVIMPPISEVECEEVHPDSRETIYMLAWVTSLIDLNLNNAERDVLMNYGQMLGFDHKTMARLIMVAKHYTLENVITPSTTKEELFAYAQKIQLSRKEAEKCQIALKRRLD